MNSFEILPHTSDFRLKIKGNCLKDLLITALDGMNSVIKKIPQNHQTEIITDKIVINSNDFSMLLIDFLSEVLTLSHTNKSVFNEVNFDEITEKKVEFSLKGFKVDGFDEDIKAVTYTETDIIKNKEGLLEATIVFDI